MLLKELVPKALLFHAGDVGLVGEELLAETLVFVVQHFLDRLGERGVVHRESNFSSRWNYIVLHVQGWRLHWT